MGEVIGPAILRRRRNVRELASIENAYQDNVISFTEKNTKARRIKLHIRAWHENANMLMLRMNAPQNLSRNGFKHKWHKTVNTVVTNGIVSYANITAQYIAAIPFAVMVVYAAVRYDELSNPLRPKRLRCRYNGWFGTFNFRD